MIKSRNNVLVHKVLWTKIKIEIETALLFADVTNALLKSIITF